MTSSRFTGFRFDVIWRDDDAIQLCISAWNGSFGGIADAYQAIGDLEKAASKLKGFPRSPTDTRELEFGSFDRKCAGGGVKMRFHCVDGAGHAYVEASIDSKYQTAGTVQTAILSMPIEASAVDTFVQQLNDIGLNRARTALLKGVETR
jgi:hypothetical protein